MHRFKPLKDKKCRCCKKLFTPHKSTQIVCSPKCAIEYANAKIKKQVKKESLKKKKEFIESTMTTSDWKKKLQTVFNKYIRLRDLEKGCVSCDTPLHNRKYDAGHFYPTTYQCLRFDEENVHGQCVRCNRDMHGNIHEYRKRITNRITKEQLQWLDDNRYQAFKWTKEDYIEKIEYYKKKIKEYDKLR